MASDERSLRTFEVAHCVQDVLATHGIRCAVIGAMALAAHRYARDTSDFDLATSTDPFGALARAARELRAAGFEIETSEPDAQDPLGGVVNVDGPDFDRVQIVNFLNPWSHAANPGFEAIETAIPLPGTRLRVVDLPHLVALKLYAGGAASERDVIEVLVRNAPIDAAALRDVCGRFGLAAPLEKILAEIGRT